MDSDQQYEFLKNMIDILAEVDAANRRQAHEDSEALTARLDHWLGEIAGCLDRIEQYLNRIDTDLERIATQG
jgi:hypothetical protein